MSTGGEVDANFSAFSSKWKSDLTSSIAKLDGNEKDFLLSYRRIVSLNAWRGNILESQISEGSLSFFSEALNDALVSHVLARSGSWRTSLMSLRSCLENTCYCLFYKDHPVELRLWESGKHRPSFSEVHTYLEEHPDVSQFRNSPLSGLGSIKEEFGTLSRAVHASAKSFRMTPGKQGAVLWKVDPGSLGQWRSREQRVVCAINLLLLTIYREHLQGAQQLFLRSSLAAAIPTAFHSDIKKQFKVTVPIS
jgi:hypothetical protein